MLKLCKILIMNESNVENFENREDLKALINFGGAFKIFFRTHVPKYVLEKFSEIDLIKCDFEKCFAIKLEDPTFNDKLEENSIYSGKNSEKEQNKNNFFFYFKNSLNQIDKYENDGNIIFNDSKENLCKSIILNILVNDFVKENLLKPERNSLVNSIKKMNKINFNEENLYNFDIEFSFDLEKFLKKLFRYVEITFEGK